MRAERNWPRYAKALDLRLEGHTLEAIAQELGVSRERARQIITLAKAVLAYRVFKHVPHPNFTRAVHREYDHRPICWRCGLHYCAGARGLDCDRGRQDEDLHRPA